MIRLIKNNLSVRKFGLILVSLVIFGYAVFETHDLVLGPKLTLSEPQQTIFGTTSPTVLIKGQAFRISTIHLNGRQIFTTKDGLFSEEMVLLPGYNILRLDTQDKFGRQVNRRLQIWRQSESNLN